MDPTVLSANLRRIRAAKGKSQVELAEAASLSRPGYRNIEGGASAPRVDTLIRIADALDVRLEALLAPVRELRTVRFRANKKMNTRGELLSDVAAWLDDYSDLEKLLGCREACAFAEVAESLGTAVRGLERAKLAAKRARERAGLSDKEIIHDVCGLLEDTGVKVFTSQLASEGFFGLSVGHADGGPAIVVNTWDRLSVERWIFTAAHELGHLILHASSYDVTQTAEDKVEEKEADTFASYFLMPETLFEKEYAKARGLSLVRAVMKLKRIFRVSCTSVVDRIASKSTDPRLVWTKFQNEYRSLMGRELDMTKKLVAKGADEPERLGAMDFVPDRLNRLVRLALEREEISMSRAAELLRLDLKDMRALANSWVAP